MSLLSKLFGGGSGPTDPSETYEGFTIHPTPMPEGGKFRLAARIEKTVGEAVKSHQLIRADLFDSRDEAVGAAVLKAKQVIDEQGERILS